MLLVVATSSRDQDVWNFYYEMLRQEKIDWETRRPTETRELPSCSFLVQADLQTSNVLASCIKIFLVAKLDKKISCADAHYVDAPSADIRDVKQKKDRLNLFYLPRNRF